MPKTKSDLTIIINTRYASQLLEQTLDSIVKNSDYENELLVIDKGGNTCKVKRIRL